MVLVGDSLAQTMLGYENTLSVTMDEMLHHVKAVRRGVKSALLVADMPYGSYQVDPKDAVRNAARFVKEGGAEVVKIEGGEKRAELIRQIIDAEIPVAGHIGLTPQSVNVMGGYKVQGKSLSGIEQLMRDAVALDRAGVACLYLEGIPREVAAMITGEVGAPTIGIGAGPECDGQVLVFHDILNLTFGPPAKFVRRYGDAAGADHERGARRFARTCGRGSIRRMRSRIICRRRPGRGWIRCWRGSGRWGGRSELLGHGFARIHTDRPSEQGNALALRIV